jgi:glycosyltransferase involved in cell wall biosynthesis
MEIYYVANARIPTEKAHGLQTMQMAAAFVRQGIGVELIVARRDTALSADPFVWYGIKEKFLITWLPILDLASWGIRIPRISAPLQNGTFALSVWWHLLRKPRRPVFTRDVFAGFLLSFTHRVTLELHTFPGSFSWLHRWLYRRSHHVVVLTDQLRQRYIAAGVPADRITVAADGVDIQQFQSEESSAASRTALGLPTDKIIVMYTGNLFRWKGVYTLADATKQLDSSFCTVIVGGSDRELAAFRSYVTDHAIANMIIVGNRPPAEMPTYLHAADMVVLPNSGQAAISRWYTSPLKMFEYMAAQRPIIASDLPSIREVLNEKNASLVPADDAAALAAAIQEVAVDHTSAAVRAKQAFAEVQQYTWDARVERIMPHLQ